MVPFIPEAAENQNRPDFKNIINSTGGFNP
jgi:hypothetical protein